MADLTSIPNVGPRIAADLRRLSIHEPDDLRGRDGDQLYDELCATDGAHHDICVRDTFVAAIAYVETGDDRPWWMHSRGTARCYCRGSGGRAFHVKRSPPGVLVVGGSARRARAWSRSAAQPTTPRITVAETTRYDNPPHNQQRPPPHQREDGRFM